MVLCSLMSSAGDVCAVCRQRIRILLANAVRRPMVSKNGIWYGVGKTFPGSEPPQHAPFYVFQGGKTAIPRPKTTKSQRSGRGADFDADNRIPRRLVYYPQTDVQSLPVPLDSVIFRSRGCLFFPPIDSAVFRPTTLLPSLAFAVISKAGRSCSHALRWMTFPQRPLEHSWSGRLSIAVFLPSPDDYHAENFWSFAPLL